LHIEKVESRGRSPYIGIAPGLLPTAQSYLNGSLTICNLTGFALIGEAYLWRCSQQKVPLDCGYVMRDCDLASGESKYIYLFAPPTHQFCTTAAVDRQTAFTHTRD